MTNGRVYFARCYTAKGADMGAIKVGCSYHVPNRLLAVECNQPFNLRLVGTCPGTLFEEAVAHLWLKSHRIGGEFFHDHPDVVSFMEEAITKQVFPLGISVAREHMPSAEEAKYFMQRHGLTIADLAAATGVRSTMTYAPPFKRGVAPNRRIVAAMMVAALRKGQRINWPRDLSYIEAEAA